MNNFSFLQYDVKLYDSSASDDRCRVYHRVGSGTSLRTLVLSNVGGGCFMVLGRITACCRILL